MASSKDALPEWSCWQHSTAQPDAKLYMRWNGIASSTKSQCKLSKRTTSKQGALRGYYCHHHINQKPVERIKSEAEAHPAAESEVRHGGIRAAPAKSCTKSEGTPSQEGAFGCCCCCCHHRHSTQEAPALRKSGTPALQSAVRLVTNVKEGWCHYSLSRWPDIHWHILFCRGHAEHRRHGHGGRTLDPGATTIRAAIVAEAQN